MILKIVQSAVVMKGPDEVSGEVRVERFFDGFYNATVEDCDEKDVETLGVYYFIDDNNPVEDRQCKKITLVGKDDVKIVYADRAYDVYLMSDEGKTIERIN